MSYSTALQVRRRLPHLLIDEDLLGIIDSGKYLELNNPAYDVPTIEADGTALVKDTGFTFRRPYHITLTTEADGESYIASVYIGASDAELEELIASADRFIDDYFANYAAPGASYLADWSSVMAAAYFLRQYATATESNLERAAALEKQVYDAMENYRDNTSFDSAERKPRRSYVIKVNG